MALKSGVQPCDTSLVRAGDMTWERIGDELVAWVYGNGFRVCIAGQDLATARAVLDAIDTQANLDAIEKMRLETQAR